MDGSQEKLEAGLEAEAEAELESGGSNAEEEVEYRSYVRRYFVMLSFSLSMMAWNLSGLRHTPVAPSYAKYHGIPNQVSAPPLWGVDMFTMASNVVTIFAYLPSSYFIDRYGLVGITLGSLLVALCTWGWYFAKQNTTLVVLSIGGQALFGPLVSTSLLAISNRWFPPHERVKATAIGNLLGTLGAGLAFVVPEQFSTSRHEVVDLALKSCRAEKVVQATVAAFNLSASRNETLACTGVHLAAKNQFCCYLPLAIERLNLVMALVSTAAFLFSAVAVRNLPPTPPAPSGKQASYGGIWSSLKQCFGNQRFTKLAISDALVSGPPMVVVATIARIFPAQISKLSSLASILGMALAVPATVLAGHFLDRTKAYWTFTFGGYVLGTIFWAVATLCIATGTLPGAYVFMGSVVLAMAMYICWQAAVFETKLEYVFDPFKPLEGVIVAADRVVINLSSLLFLSTIPPERVGGARNTFYIGLAVMALGVIPTAIIKDRYRYLRMVYDDESKEEEKAIESDSCDTAVARKTISQVIDLP